MKIKSLAAEARIIRGDEHRAIRRRRKAFAAVRKPGDSKKFYAHVDGLWRLYLTRKEHRNTVVRNEQRSSLLAYGFIRGKAYGPMEKPADDNPPDLDRVLAIVNKFGGQKVEKAVLLSWVAGTLEAHPFAKPKPVSDAA